MAGSASSTSDAASDLAKVWVDACIFDYCFAGHKFAKQDAAEKAKQDAAEKVKQAAEKVKKDAALRELAA